MTSLRLAATTIALLGFGTCLADEAPDNATEASEATEIPAAAAAEFRWSDFASDVSTLRQQANAVYVALRAREAAERGIEIDFVSIELADTDEADSSRVGFCRHMGTPDSRIMRERCTYQSTDEKAFNDYQFREEIEQIREMQELMWLENAEYELAYRRSLMQRQ